MCEKCNNLTVSFCFNYHIRRIKKQSATVQFTFYQCFMFYQIRLNVIYEVNCVKTTCELDNIAFALVTHL